MAKRRFAESPPPPWPGYPTPPPPLWWWLAPSSCFFGRRHSVRGQKECSVGIAIFILRLPALPVSRLLVGDLRLQETDTHFVLPDAATARAAPRNSTTTGSSGALCICFGRHPPPPCAGHQPPPPTAECVAGLACGRGRRMAFAWGQRSIAAVAGPVCWASQ